ncbi:MAG: DUF4115 domain-containing protein [Gammaproteobacteria bacterium]|nr:DUF4115 domain-containing protein [Gammaproteobacteria bacterium]
MSDGFTGSIGEHLVRAREAHKISRAHIASQLFLSERIVKALEGDDYDTLPAPIFVCGYLRSYARIVEIEAEPLIAAYNQRGDSPPSVVSHDANPEVRKQHIDVDRGWMINVARYVAIGVAVSVVLYLLWAFVPTLFSGAGDDEQGEEVAAGMEFDGGGLPAFESMPVAAPFETPAAPDAPPINVGKGDKPKFDKPAAAPTVVDPVEVVVEEAPIIEVAAPAAEAAVVPDVPKKSPISGPHSTLRLKFSHESWVEVHDATGRRVLVDLMREGGDKTLYGQAPFKLLLGYSSGVVIEYNGALYDPENYKRKGVARFSIGKPEDNKER